MAEARTNSRGFTLLEILMVMAIIGLLAGVALPQMQKVAESVEISNQRTDLLTSIESLGYRAYVSAGPVLMMSSGAGVAGGSGISSALKIPAGWRVEVSTPIRYAINGVCSGGRLTLTDPRGTREVFMLRPPRCLLEPASATE